MLLALSGCGALSTTDQGADSSTSEPGLGAPFGDGTAVDGDAGGEVTTDAARAPSVPSALFLAEDRSIIRTASIRVQTQDVAAAATSAARSAQGLGGLVTDEQVVIDPDDADRTTANLTLRVPSDQMPQLITAVGALGSVLEQTQQANDVTAQVVDVDARVDSQRASVRRLQALLSQANTIGEVVKIETQLSIRQADLEALEAQQKSLADQTTLATLYVAIVGPDPVGTADDPTGFFAGLERGWTAFVAAWTTGLTGLGAALPFIGFFLVLALPLAYWLRSRAREESTTTAMAEPPTENSEEEALAGR